MAMEIEGSGNNDWMDVDLSATIDDIPMTVSFWFRTLSTNPTSEAIFQWAQASVGTRYWMIYFNSSNKLLSWDRTSGATAASTTDWGDQAWHHVVSTRYPDPSDLTIDLYVDGNLDATDTGNSSDVMNFYDRVSLGRAGDSSPGDYMDVSVAELGMWNDQLGDDEIEALAAGYAPSCVRRQNLVHYWPLIRDGRELASGEDMTSNGTVDPAAHPRIIYPPRPSLGFVGGAAAPPATRRIFIT
ncbi:MAG: LamG domain-containing protein [Myxococcales bacterium FL481]|nr:MAG: LamG domain-containing protein [Myxococcales bacterium FL481]